MFTRQGCLELLSGPLQSVRQQVLDVSADSGLVGISTDRAPVLANLIREDGNIWNLMRGHEKPDVITILGLWLTTGFDELLAEIQSTDPLTMHSTSPAIAQRNGVVTCLAATITATQPWKSGRQKMPESRTPTGQSPSSSLRGCRSIL